MQCLFVNLISNLSYNYESTFDEDLSKYGVFRDFGASAKVEEPKNKKRNETHKDKNKTKHIY